MRSGTVELSIETFRFPATGGVFLFKLEFFRYYINMDLKKFKGKKIALLGFGVENIAVGKFFTQQMIDFQILDKAEVGQLSTEAQETIKTDNLKIITGADYLSHLVDFDIVVRTPGIPYLAPEIQKAEKMGVEITSSTKLFFELCPAKIIGVTGTKGKGTTASLIYEIVKRNIQETGNNNQTNQKFQISNSEKIPGLITHKSNFENVYLAGNIGIPAFQIIEDVKPRDIVIFELSSFQSQDMKSSPNIAVIVNLDQDHLDYHKSLEEYRSAKYSILKYQNPDNFAIINWDYPELRKVAKFGKAKKYYFSSKEEVDQGAFVSEKGEVFLTIGQKEKVCSEGKIKLIGRHNLENIAAASIVGKILQIPIENISGTVKDFQGLPHRLELVREIDGIKIYNDSFSTNPIPTIAAIKSFSEPITLILGGSSKGADFSELAKTIKSSSVKNILLIGVEGPKIRKILEEENTKINILNGGRDIQEIAENAFKTTENGGVILFSPACASFDLFKNYKDRGEKFKRVVAGL